MVGYKTFAASAIGENHKKEMRICQDYSARFEDANLAIVAVADGHGGTPHFRSDRGAAFACEAAVRCIKRKFYSNEAMSHLDFKGFFEPPIKDIASSITAEWRNRIIEDWNADVPAMPNEKEETVNLFLNPPEIYGSTLIAAVVTPQITFGLQIGDGRCVVIKKDGAVKQPIPWDDNCYLNVTTSLCDPEAEKYFRFFYNDEPPAALFIGTDGVDNSYPLFENEIHLEKLYRAVARNFGSAGFEEGEKQLADFLPELSKKGSGDDVSIAGIIDMESALWRRD